MPEAKEPAAPRPGETIAGKYRLVRPIGTGAMGLVFEATHLRLRQKVAIKFMQPKLVGQPEATLRFEREGRAASGLTSPHATRIYDVDSTAEGLPYIVSELLEGHDLRMELEERGKLPTVEAASYLIEACAAMAEAHALGIVHRDLKPSNLFLAETPNGRIVKVLDFGISRIEEELELTTTGMAIGSPRYMAPEQVEGKRVDRRIDLWALGVILFRALSGGFPFEGTSSISLGVAILTHTPRKLVDLVPEVSPGLSAAVERALARDLNARYSTAAEFAEALAPYATAEASALARTLTRSIAVASSSKPSLHLDAPLAETLTAESKMEIDILVGNLESSQATKGTWTQARAAESAGPVKRRRLALPIAAAAAVLVGGLVTLRYVGGDARTPAALSQADPLAPASAPASSQAPPPAQPATESAAPPPPAQPGGSAAPAASAAAAERGVPSSPAPSNSTPVRPRRPAQRAEPAAAPPPPAQAAPPPQPRNPNYL